MPSPRPLIPDHDGRVTCMVRRHGQRRRLQGDADTTVVHGRTTGDGGYTLALTALMLIPLMVFLAFAVDLGAWYGQASKVQRAADAAAMAGVVWLPSTAKADTEAQNAAKANGVTTGLTYAAVGTNQYKVTIAKPAPRIFSQVFGTSAFNITRSAIAQYNKPVPLGSPTNKFGNDMSASCAQFQPTSTAPCGPQPMLWGAINGPYESHANGDPYSTKCSSSTSGSACNVPANTNGAANADYRKEGFTYGIDVGAADVGKTLTIQGWDVGQFARTTSANAASGSDCNRLASPFNVAPYSSGGGWASGFSASNCQAGDSGTQKQNFDIQLFDNDGSDLTVDKTTALASCHYRLLTSDAGYGATKNAWTTICSFTALKKGIYPFEVRNSGLTSPTVADATSMTGYNAFSLKVTGGTNTRLYGINDMSIWTNIPGSVSTFYLAEILPEHAGKKIRIDLFDPGDGSGAPQFSLAVKAPAAGAPAAVPTSGTTIPAANVASSCKYNATKTSTRAALDTATLTAAANCSVVTKPANSGTATYNDGWLRIEIQIDAGYDCGPSTGVADCWWTVAYNFGGAGFPTDRTVWSLNVVGDPVHLVQ